MTDFECGIFCMLILSRCASGMAGAAHLHIFVWTSCGLEVAVHMQGKGDIDVGNYILFPRVYTNYYPYGFEGEGL